jgi:hypothetical protein
MQNIKNAPKLRVPGILCDIDGVLYRGKRPIARSPQALKCLLSEHTDPSTRVKFKFPFFLLTNGGGILESERAKVVNKAMFDPKDDFPHRVTGDRMILCHTPLKTLAPIYHDKHVLVAGYGDLINVAVDHGFTKAILAEELFALMPEICPLNTKVFAPSQLEELARNCLLRLEKESKEELLNEIKFSAIMMMSDCFWHELHIQIFSDLIRSKDGRLGDKGSKLHYRKRSEP